MVENEEGEEEEGRGGKLLLPFSFFPFLFFIFPSSFPFQSIHNNISSFPPFPPFLDIILPNYLFSRRRPWESEGRTKYFSLHGEKGLRSVHALG